MPAACCDNGNGCGGVSPDAVATGFAYDNVDLDIGTGLVHFALRLSMFMSLLPMSLLAMIVVMRMMVIVMLMLLMMMMTLMVIAV